MRSTLTTLVVVSALTGTAVFAQTPAPNAAQLVAAVKAGESATALSLLQRKADPNAAEVDGTTALHWAVRNGDVTLLDRLLRAGAKADAANRYGVTALPLACQQGDPAIVERLLNAGLSANLTGPLGETALHTCARSGHVAAAKMLVTRGASLNAVESWRGQTPIMWAAAQGHGEMVAMLAEAGADVNARSGIIAWERQRTSEPRDKWLPPGGFTPLLFAAREGRVDAAKALIAAGADVSAIDPDRQSALVIALINGHFDVANLLIDNGADVNAADKVGRTALWAAVDYNTPPQSNRPAPNPFDEEATSLDVIKNLLAHGARVDAALTAQVPYRTKLDRGADGVLGAGTTPLLRAAKAGDTPVVKLLLERGDNPKAVTRNGVNGLMMAANVAAREEDRTGRGKTQKDAIETITLMLAAGVDVNAADTLGRTAVHGAALWGLTDVVRFLHKSGATLDVEDKRRFTPLEAALGMAGGFGFDSKSSVVREDTAKAIRELMGVAPDYVPPARPHPPAPGGGRNAASDD
ncbi:MAG TPA: ankyrin repeat domain-containing protein [Vicinamibacterales bacterium]|nr:ankyrin repeat domain-containing protein [Vicinamibacterales bacterium]